MIASALDSIRAWLLRTFAWARAHPTLAGVFAALLVALVILSPIPPVP